jgi:energy-coupling factor transporter ATP-binding protein EcfA2
MVEEQIQKKEIFNLPISFLEDKCELEKHIITDLELNETEKNKSLYDFVFLPTPNNEGDDISYNSFGKNTIRLWSKYYTANKEFIKDSQKLQATYGAAQAQAEQAQQATYGADNADNYKEVQTIWREIQEETGFIYKYQYIEYERFEKYNNNPVFLQCLSLFNMTSPVISLLAPLFFLIMPIILLKIQGVPFSSEMYVTTLKLVFQKHHIGQLFSLKSASIDKVIYVLISFAFYCFQIYQNIMACIKFFKNMHKIHSQLFTIRDYLTKTLEKMKLLETQCAGLKTYSPFIRHMNEKMALMKEMIDDYNKITPFTSLFSLKKIVQVGQIMKCFYQLYNKEEYKEVLEYTFGFNGYLENLAGLQENIRKENVGLWQAKQQQQDKKQAKKKQANKGKKVADAIFKNAYFPSLVNSNPVKNTYELKKHMLITGPNAAGKTTLLKTTIFNIILSQQTGYGFYEKAEFEPYDMIHCYINIPDTSGRDSLFQAEARRCKEILDKITSVEHLNNDDKVKRHFCVFDELYSGTNPYEAIGSAYAYLSYLNKFPNVNFVLTTHFLDLCKRFTAGANEVANEVVAKEEVAAKEEADTSAVDTSAVETSAADTSAADTSAADTNKKSKSDINNYHMRINTDEKNNFTYTYQLEKGISTVKGGVKVLTDLAYPKEIINQMKKVLTEIII